MWIMDRNIKHMESETFCLCTIVLEKGGENLPFQSALGILNKKHYIHTKHC